MSTKNNIIACDKRCDVFLITLSSGFFYTISLIASVKCFSCLTMIKIVSLIVLIFCYKMSAAVRLQTSDDLESRTKSSKKEKIRAMIGANFHHYSVAYGVMSVRLHTFIIGFRPATRLMISSCRVVTALALITRAPPYLTPC